jgi:hypothetical protein
MKITKKYLKHLIKEELEKTVKEQGVEEGVGEFFTKARQKIFGKNKEEKTAEIADIIKKSQYYTNLQKIADKGSLTKQDTEKYIKAIKDKKWDKQGGAYIEEADEETKELFRQLFIEEIKTFFKASSKKTVDQAYKIKIIDFIRSPWGLFTPEEWVEKRKRPFDRAKDTEEKNAIMQEMFDDIEKGYFDFSFRQKFGRGLDIQMYREILKGEVFWLFKNKQT